MARTSSGRHCRMMYHDMVHLFTSGFESTFITFLRTFHFLLHTNFFYNIGVNVSEGVCSIETTFKQVDISTE